MTRTQKQPQGASRVRTMAAFGVLVLLTVTFSAMSFRVSGPSANNNATVGPALKATSINVPFQHWDLREFPNCTIPWSVHDGTLDVGLGPAGDALQNAFNTWQAVTPALVRFNRVIAPAGAKCPLLFDGSNTLGWDGINCGMPSDDTWGPGIPVAQQVCHGDVPMGGIIVNKGVDGWLSATLNGCCDDKLAMVIATGQLVVIDGGNGVIETKPAAGGDDTWDPAIPVAQRMCYGAVAPGGIILRDPNPGGDGNITPANNCCDDKIVGGNVVDGGDGVITTLLGTGALADTTLGITAVFDNPATGVILESDILFNDGSYLWQNVAHNARMNGNPDIEHIAAHEIGHMLGLHHPPGLGLSNPPGPMMNPGVWLSNDVWNAAIPAAQQGCYGTLGAGVGPIIMAVGANGVDVGGVNNCCDDVVVALVGGIGVRDGGNGIVDSVPAGDDVWNPVVPVASRVCYGAVPAGTILYADGGAGGLTPPNNCCDDTIVGLNVVDGGDGRITTSLIADPANHNLGADDMDGLNWQYTPDLGDAPDPWRGEFNKYQTLVHSSVTSRKLNGVQLFKPAAGPYHLFGWPGTAPGNGLFQFEFLGPNMDNSALECEARVPDMDAFDDGVALHGVLIRGALNRITVTVNTSGQPGRYDSTDQKKTLFMNGYLDFNDDCVFDIADFELFWEGTPQSPAGMPGQCTTVLASGNFVPPATKAGNICTLNFDVRVPLLAPDEFYCRFRLDYGEDEARVQNISGDLGPATGAAQFGEVEDYKCETDIMDQLHLIVPFPNQLVPGELAMIEAVVEANFNGAHGVNVICERAMGDFTFASGTVAPGGASTVVVTDENGIALIEVLAGATPGPAMVACSVGDDLQAFAIFEVVPDPLLGDVNGDGQTDVNDITYVLFRLGSSDLSADADGDGLVSVNDVSFVLFRLGG